MEPAIRPQEAAGRLVASAARVQRIGAARAFWTILKFLTGNKKPHKTKAWRTRPPRTQPPAPLKPRVSDLPPLLLSLCPAPRPPAPASLRPQLPGARSAGPSGGEPSYLLDPGREPAFPRGEGAPNPFV